MAIHIDILARINQNQTQREANALADQLEASGLQMGERMGSGIADGLARSSPKVQRALNSVANATSDTAAAVREYNRTLSSPASEEHIRNSERLARARRAESDSHRAAAVTIRASADALNDIKGATESAADSLIALGRKAGGVMRGLGTAVALPAIQGLVDLAQVSATASQSVLLLPAAATAAAAGIGTLMLATEGFGQAMKDIRDPEKFAEDLANLGPNAQQAALAIQSILPQIDGLRKATSDSFFAGVGQKILDLAAMFGPRLQAMTTNIADSFNQMFHGITDAFMSPFGQGQIDNILNNVSQTFQNLVPGVEAFSNAMLILTSAGSNALPALADSVSGLAQDFSNFITTAQATGDLDRWINEGIEAAKLLGEAVWEIGKIIFQIFSEDGKANIASFRDDLQTITEALHLLAGDFGSFNDEAKNSLTFGADIREELDMLEGPSAKIRDFFMNLRHYSDIAVNAIIDFANIAKDSLLNGPIKTLNGFIDLMSKPLKALGFDIGDTSSVIPKVPDIPHIDVTPFNAWQTQKQWQQDNVPSMDSMNGLPSAKDRPPPRGPDGLFPVPQGKPIDPKTGKPMTDKQIREQALSSIDPSQYQVDPYAAVPGLPGGSDLGKTINGLPVPLSAMKNNAGRPGFGVVDQQAVLEADHRVRSEAHDLEEARKSRIALEMSNNASQHEIDEARWKEVEAGWSLQKAQADLAEKQRGTTKSLKAGMEEMGAALDPDFGLGKGLAGFAENLTRFVANLAMAPMMGQLSAIAQANPIQGGYGLMGILGAQNIAAGKSPLLGRPMGSGGIGDLLGIPGTGQLSIAQGLAGSANGAIGATTSAFASVPTNFTKGLNLSTVPVAAQKYANDCIDASARIILSHSGVNMSEDDIMKVITPGGTIGSQSAGLNKLNPAGNYQAMPGSGGSEQAMFAAIKASIDNGTGSILNVAPGSSIAGRNFSEGHFIAATGYNPDGTINLSDTANGKAYTVSAADAYQATRGMGIVAGTGTGPAPVPGMGMSQSGTKSVAAPGAGAEGWRDTVASTVAKYGPAAGIRPENMQAWTDAIVKQIDTESKGDPNAYNGHDSNGRGGTQVVSGLLQYLDSTYANTGGKATGLPKADPVGQIAGALYAPRTPDGRPDVNADGGIGAGHGWSPNSTPTQFTPPAPIAPPPVYGPPIPVKPSAPAPLSFAGPGNLPSAPGGWTPDGSKHQPIPDGNFNPAMKIDTSTSHFVRPVDDMLNPGVGERFARRGPEDYNDYLGWLEDASGPPPEWQMTGRGITGGPVKRGPMLKLGPDGGAGPGLFPGQTGGQSQMPGMVGPFPVPSSVLPPGGSTPPRNDLRDLLTGGYDGGRESGVPGAPTPTLNSGFPGDFRDSPGANQGTGMVGPLPVPQSVMPPGGVPTPPGANGMPPGGPTGDATPTRIGGVTPGVAMGGNGGVGLTPGGSVDSALSMAAAAADVFAPGAGQAAQVGIKLGARAAQYAGQVAAIGVNGLMETFLPTGGSELANSGWIPRIAGGLAGAKAALPNVAGGATGGNDPNGQGQPGQGAPPLTPEQAAMNKQDNTNSGTNVTNNIEMNSFAQTEDRNGADMARHLTNAYQGSAV